MKNLGHTHPASEGLEDLATAHRLEQLASRYVLGEHQRVSLELILLALAADRRAPTAVRAPPRAVDVHLADSLAALEVDALRGAQSLADIGAGAGFPGLALAVALPAASVNLVESQARKCRFMEAVCAAAGIANTQVVCVRVEEWTAGRVANDAVLARALAEPAVVLEYAAPLLRRGGALVEWRGRRDPASEREACSVAQRLGLELSEIRHVVPYAGAREHHLHVYTKTGDTPDGFPRRAGMARKRPLTA